MGRRMDRGANNPEGGGVRGCGLTLNQSYSHRTGFQEGDLGQRSSFQGGGREKWLDGS